MVHEAKGGRSIDAGFTINTGAARAARKAAGGPAAETVAARTRSNGQTQSGSEHTIAVRAPSSGTKRAEAPTQQSSDQPPKDAHTGEPARKPATGRPQEHDFPFSPSGSTPGESGRGGDGTPPSENTADDGENDKPINFYPLGYKEKVAELASEEARAHRRLDEEEASLEDRQEIARQFALRSGRLHQEADNYLRNTLAPQFGTTHPGGQPFSSDEVDEIQKVQQVITDHIIPSGRESSGPERALMEERKFFPTGHVSEDTPSLDDRPNSIYGILNLARIANDALEVARVNRVDPESFYGEERAAALRAVATLPQKLHRQIPPGQQESQGSTEPTPGGGQIPDATSEPEVDSVTPPPPAEPPRDGSETRTEDSGEGREEKINRIDRANKEALARWQREHEGETTVANITDEALRGFIPRRILELADPERVDIVRLPVQRDNSLRFFIVERRPEEVTNEASFHHARQELYRILSLDMDPPDQTPDRVDTMVWEFRKEFGDGFTNGSLTRFHKPLAYSSIDAIDTESGTVMYENRFEVHPDLRGQKVAKNFYEDLRTFAGDQGFTEIVSQNTPERDADNTLSPNEIYTQLGRNPLNELPQERRERAEQAAERSSQHGPHEWLLVDTLEPRQGGEPHDIFLAAPPPDNPANPGNPHEETEQDERPQFTLRGNEVAFAGERINISTHEVEILQALMSTDQPMSASEMALEMEAVSSRPLGKYTSRLARTLLDKFGTEIIHISEPTSHHDPLTYQLNPAFRYEHLSDQTPVEREVSPYYQRISAVPQRFAEERPGTEYELRIRTDHTIVDAHGNELRFTSRSDTRSDVLFVLNVFLNNEPLTVDQIRTTQGFETTAADPARKCREAIKKLRRGLSRFGEDYEFVQRIETEEGMKFGFNPNVRIVDEREEYKAARRAAEIQRSADKAAARQAGAERRRVVAEQRQDNPYYQKLSDIPASLTEELPNAYTIELHNDHTIANPQGQTFGLEGNSLYIVNALINSSGPQTIEEIMAHGFTTQSPDAPGKCREAMRDIRARFFRFSEDVEIIQRFETQDGGVQFAINPMVRFVDRREEFAEQMRAEAEARALARPGQPAREPTEIWHSPAEIRAAERAFVESTYNDITEAGRHLEPQHPTLGSSLEHEVAGTLDKPLDIVRDILVIDRFAKALDIDLSPQQFPRIRNVDAYKRAAFRHINKAIKDAKLNDAEKLLFGLHLGLPSDMKTYRSFTLVHRPTGNEIPYDRYYRWTQSPRENHGRDLEAIRENLFRNTPFEQMQRAFDHAVAKVQAAMVATGAVILSQETES